MGVCSDDRRASGLGSLGVVGATEAVLLLELAAEDVSYLSYLLCGCKLPSAQPAGTFLRFQLFFTVIQWLKRSELLPELEKTFRCL